MKVGRKKAHRFRKSAYKRLRNYKTPCKTPSKKRFKRKLTEIDKITVRLAFTFL